jgi:hypothetical protein
MNDWSGLPKDLLVGLLTGIVASASYEKLAAMRRDRELRARFSGLAGDYTELRRFAESKTISTGGTIRLTYLGGRKFSTLATTKEGKQFWKGEISFNDDSDVIGSGFYQHIDRDDNGIHRVVHIATLKQFDVSGENTSHPEGVKDFKMIWKLK